MYPLNCYEGILLSKLRHKGRRKIGEDAQKASRFRRPSPVLGLHLHIVKDGKALDGRKTSRNIGSGGGQAADYISRAGGAKDNEKIRVLRREMHKFSREVQDNIDKCRIERF